MFRESFHSKFNKEFYNAHPHIFLFTDVINEWQIQTYIKMNDYIKQKYNKKIKKEATLQRYTENFREGTLTRIHFVRLVSAKFAPTED